MELTSEVLKFIILDLLVTHFYLQKHEFQNSELHLYFEEKSKLPEEFTKELVTSHGFHKQITIQDFPLKGKTVFLHIKRRR